MKTKLLKNSYVLPMTLFCSALTFSPLGVAQAHATTNVVQQAKTVKGTVVDETGEPVIGASVMVKGTSVGCATDLDGNFTLQNIKPEQTLTISYIGYTAQTIAIGQQTNFNVVLKPDNKVLNEVVVVGYGAITKRSVSTSMSTVKGSNIAEMPTSNITQSLSGLSSGITLQQTVENRVQPLPSASVVQVPSIVVTIHFTLLTAILLPIQNCSTISTQVILKTFKF